MTFEKRILPVYFILGSQNVLNDNPLVILEKALQGGITAFQFREKGKGSKVGSEKFELAQQMQALCLRYRVPFIVNDDVDLAISLKADGIHIGQDDRALEDVKGKTKNTNMFIGVSARTKDEARIAIEGGADYIGVGPVEATTTKDDAKAPIGLSGIRALKDEVGSFPIVAIGGIQLSNVKAIRQAGADGVSVISAISESEDPEIMIQQLLAQSM